jgi:hypothetical protein
MIKVARAITIDTITIPRRVLRSLYPRLPFHYPYTVSPMPFGFKLHKPRVIYHELWLD